MVEGILCGDGVWKDNALWNSLWKVEDTQKVEGTQQAEDTQKVADTQNVADAQPVTNTQKVADTQPAIDTQKVADTQPAITVDDEKQALDMASDEEPLVPPKKKAKVPPLGRKKRMQAILGDLIDK